MKGVSFAFISAPVKKIVPETSESHRGACGPIPVSSKHRTRTEQWVAAAEIIMPGTGLARDSQHLGARGSPALQAGPVGQQEAGVH